MEYEQFSLVLMAFVVQTDDGGALRMSCNHSLGCEERR